MLAWFIVLLLCLGLNTFRATAKPGLFFKAKQGSIHLMSFNAMMGLKVNELSEESRKERIRSKITTVDVLCAQEINEVIEKDLVTLLKLTEHHKIPGKSAKIYSKYPIISKGQIDFGPGLNSCLWADIVFDQHDTVRIFSAHLESLRLRRSSYEFLVDVEAKYDKAKKGFQDLFDKYPDAAAKRADQALQLKKAISKSPYPVLICGDFNDTPSSFTYRTMKKGLTDTFLTSGKGVASTWRGGIPMLRIDYIFAGKEFENRSFRTINSDLSDHYPIVASFTLN